MLRCSHHWLIEAPNGQELVRGVCRKCNEVRMFKSELEPSRMLYDIDWENEKRMKGVSKIRERIKARKAARA